MGVTNLDTVQAATQETVTLAGASAAIGIKVGTLVITKAGVAVLTLAAPTAGSDDGSMLTVVSSTAFAHTITTPTNKLNGGSTTLTYAAAAGNTCKLVAYNGVWYVVSLNGVTVS